MSQSMLGGDPTEMAAMASQFDRQAEAVQAVIAALGKEAAKVGTVWTGQGAVRFKQAWDNYQVSFQRMSDELREASRVIGTYRQNIESATQ
jgi:WXG100 family type VII secretion target